VNIHTQADQLLYTGCIIVVKSVTVFLAIQ